ncbi:hypothetical protein COLO4_35928 [Corchorus olitorius]|uniref:Uncharacterized protein n=1 Tax=Corchorus olitorius TaxID=93759 RepID=A0A1R3GBR2_9ROSI|nr:hypothetical protein COLO4_35928 [Corchorus olitorius]
MLLDASISKIKDELATFYKGNIHELEFLQLKDILTSAFRMLESKEFPTAYHELERMKGEAETCAIFHVFMDSLLSESL